MVRTCLPIIRPCKNHLARHCEGSKKKGKTKEVAGRQCQRVDRTGLDCPESRRAMEDRQEIEAAGCEIIGGAHRS